MAKIKKRYINVLKKHPNFNWLSDYCNYYGFDEKTLINLLFKSDDNSLFIYNDALSFLLKKYNLNYEKYSSEISVIIQPCLKKEIKL